MRSLRRDGPSLVVLRFPHGCVRVLWPWSRLYRRHRPRPVSAPPRRCARPMRPSSLSAQAPGASPAGRRGGPWIGGRLGKAVGGAVVVGDDEPIGQEGGQGTHRLLGVASTTGGS